MNAHPNDFDGETSPCRACGVELPLEVVQALELLYGGRVLDPATLAASIADGLRENRYGGDAGGDTGGDAGNTLGSQSVWEWLGFETAWPEALCSAVRHRDVCGRARELGTE